jgi:hypothetical protein
MSFLLNLTLTQEHVVAEVLKPLDEPLFSALHKRFLSSSLAPQLAVRPECIDRVEVAWADVSGSLATALDHAWTTLNSVSRSTLKGAACEATLGLSFSRVGVLALATDSQAVLNAKTGEALAAAWVGHHWAVHPSSQVIRWQGLDKDQKLLVSCIDRPVFEQLDEFTRQQGLRFTRCTPALMTGIKAFASRRHLTDPAQPAHRILAWTEAAGTTRRSNPVQLLRFKGHQLEAVWRGWLTAPLSLTTPDLELDGAIQRFCIHHKAPQGEPVSRQHWPTQLEWQSEF